jgi:hypothetical protein
MKTSPLGSRTAEAPPRGEDITPPGAHVPLGTDSTTAWRDAAIRMTAKSPTRRKSTDVDLPAKAFTALLPSLPLGAVFRLQKCDRL